MMLAAWWVMEVYGDTVRKVALKEGTEPAQSYSSWPSYKIIYADCEGRIHSFLHGTSQDHDLVCHSCNAVQM